MGKYIALFVITAICLCTAFIVPNAAESFLPQVTTVMTTVNEYCESVTGTGTIRYKEQAEVTSSLPLVISTYVVNVGDTVVNGDIIANVDKKATESLISGLAQLSGLISNSANMSTIISLIPDAVYANADGSVISIAGNGSTVESNCSIATLAVIDDLIFHAAVSESNINSVFIGQSASITGTGFNGKTYKGTVKEIYPTARKRYSGTVLETVVDVIISIDEPCENLRSGYTASASIMLDEPHSICVLPYSSICQDENGEYVYVCINGGVERRNIITGAELSNGTEIKSGISPADKVIEKPDGIKENDIVKVINK